MTPRWQAALGQALVGEVFDFAETGRPDPATLIALLAGRGWDAAAIGEHAAEQMEAELPWPHPVEPTLKQGLGAAQFQASLLAVRGLLGLVVLDVRAPSNRTTLNADELRLLREVPPHHGS